MNDTRITMTIFLNIILAILVFLAASSGVSKIMLAEQDVNFFSNYGFSNPALIAFGAAQLLGGILLIFRKTRVIGAVIVGITFLISMALLILAQSWLFTAVTLIALLMLGVVTMKHQKTALAESNSGEQ